MVEAVESKAGEGQKTEYQPFILVITGPPLHGKTTLAREMAAGSNLVPLDVDLARAALFPDKVGKMFSPDQERLIMLTSYKAVHEQARDVIRQGQPVVIAGAYTRLDYHPMLLELAKKAKVPLKIVLLECPEEEVRARLAKRNGEGSLSNVTTFEQYASIKGRYEIMSQAILLDWAHPRSPAELLRNIIQDHRINNP